jgi:hypothetical protein
LGEVSSGVSGESFSSEFPNATASVEPDPWSDWWAGPAYTGTQVHNLFTRYITEELGIQGNKNFEGLFDGRPDAYDFDTNSIYELKPLTNVAGPLRRKAEGQVSKYLRQARINDNKVLTRGDSGFITQGRSYIDIGTVRNRKGDVLSVTLWRDQQRDSGLVFYTTREVRSPSKDLLKNIGKVAIGVGNSFRFLPGRRFRPLKLN